VPLIIEDPNLQHKIAMVPRSLKIATRKSMQPIRKAANMIIVQLWQNT